MTGTRAGGLKTAAKNLANNPNFYSEIGKIGGSRPSTGGFASNLTCDCDAYTHEHHYARCAGRKGGRKSRRYQK